MNCNICDKEIQTSKDMKKHLITHWYKRAVYKCKECEFVGERNLTMEVHVGKTHSENFKCGLCEYRTENLENLELTYLLVKFMNAENVM